MPKTLRMNRNTVTLKNNVMRGRGVVLDRLHAKEPIYEDEDRKKYKNETTGGTLEILKSNRVGGLRHSRDKNKPQGADLYNREAVVRPMFAPTSGSGSSVSNNIKVPASLMKKKEKRNNIKLVF